LKQIKCHQNSTCKRLSGLPSRNALWAWAVAALFSMQAQALEVRHIVEAAVANHPIMQGQRALRDGAQIDVKTAQQQFLPTPSIGIETLSAGSQDSTYRGNATLQTYRLQQPLWTGGRLTAGLRKAEAQSEASKHAQDDAAQQLALRSVQAWSEWYAATLKQTALNSSVATHQSLFERVQRRVQDGASAAVELELTEGRLAQTLSQREGAVAQRDAARLKIAQLMGRSLAADEEPTPSKVFALPEMAQLEASALQRSPMLQKQGAQLQAQQAELQEKKAELYPEVYLRAEHLRGNYENPIMASSAYNRVYIGLSSRFGAGFSNITASEAMQRKLDAAQSEIDNNRRNISEQVQSDWQQWRSLSVRLPALERSLLATRKTAEAWDRQFMAGRKSWLEVMNTARELAQAELEWAEAQAAWFNVFWRLAIFNAGWENAIHTSTSTAPEPSPQTAPGLKQP